MDIRCLLNVPKTVTLDVYNVRGMVVKHLFTGSLGAGSFVFAWDGKDDMGQRVASGLYLVTMDYGTQVDIKRLVVIRR